MKKILLFMVTLTIMSCAAQPKMLITKQQWNELFPQRWGVGEIWLNMYPDLDIYYPSMKVDFYSYENFIAALNELKNIQLKEVVANGVVKVYRKDIREESDWLYLYEFSGQGEYEKVIDFDTFLNAPNATEEEKLRELVAFLANISHETGDGDPGNAMGLFYREELFFERFPAWGIPGHNYQDVSFTNFPPSQEPCLYPVGSQKEGEVRFPVKSYHGRGPIQLSWNFNYGAMSAAVFGDKMILLNNPNFLLESGKNAFMAAIWFWMFPQNPKPSAHEVMYQKTFKPTHLSQWGFGHTIMIINGAIEGDAVDGGMEVKDRTVTRRIYFYKKYADIFGINVGENGEQLDTRGMTSYAY
ncbi:MAG: chitinase [Brevinema sp.]